MSPSPAQIVHSLVLPVWGCPPWTRPQPFKALTLSSFLCFHAPLDLKMIALLRPFSPLLTPSELVSCDSSSKVTMNPCEDNGTR